ncbi:MAG TPA: hypothetical protein VK833_04780 [Gillisia sp.]|nr:hypothetical protein [Gillisia sp.]
MDTSVEKGKSAAIVAYLTLIGTIIAYFMNNETKNTFASFHIRQALGIHITYFLLGAFVSIFDTWMVTYAFWIFIIILWGYGLMTAIQGEQKEVPLLGNQFQKWFSTVN